MDYVTGSLCLGQFNIIDYCSRPFRTVTEMDTTLIGNINKTVKNTDRLIITGNFVFGPQNHESYINLLKIFRSRLECRNILCIIGNCEGRARRDIRTNDIFNFFGDYLEFIDEKGISLILSHYPMRDWNRRQDGAIQVYSHSHGREIKEDKENQLDVSVDNAYKLVGEYRPLTFEEIYEFSGTST